MATTERRARAAAVDDSAKSRKDPRRASSRSACADLPGGPVTLDEACDLYKGEWFLMRVTGQHPVEHVLMGEVLYHSPSRGAVTRAMKRVEKDDPHAPLGVFHSGMRLLTGDELRARLAEAAKKNPYVNAHW